MYGPEFLPVAKILCKKNISPTFICESNGIMAEDAMQMKEMYLAQFEK